ncbi:hypothetical protein Tco_1071867, partial [Tanacetum coccineum]
KKVQDTDSYEFLLANKKCIVNVEVFRTILNICPRVEGEDFTDVPNDETALTFLLDLGYKGPLNRHTNMFVDHMHQPSRTLDAIINKCLSGKTASNDKLRKLKFVRIGEDYQEYERLIPDVMLTDVIKHSESYHMFIKYSTNQIPPKKSRGKGSKGKKTAEESQETVDKSSQEESHTIADDNIIFDDPDAALELAKSIRQTEAEETEAARKKSSGRSSKSVVIQDTPSATKSKPATSKAKLKGAPSLTPTEQEAANIMQALKESKKTTSEGTGAKPGVPDEDTDITKENVILEWGDEQDSKHYDNDNDDDAEKAEKDGNADDEGDDHVSDKQDDDEDDETESDKDDIYKYKIRVRKDEDE